MEIKQIGDLDGMQANADYTQLMNTCFGLDLCERDNLFIQKHLRNPFGPSAGNFMYEAGQLVATNLFLRWEFVVGGRVIRAAQNVDGQVHPDFQKRGLFKIGQQQALQALPADWVLFGFTNEVAKPQHLKRNWQLSDRYLISIYPIHWRKFFFYRVCQQKKNFEWQPALNQADWMASREQIVEFLNRLTQQKNVTHWREDLLAWKLSLDKSLRIRLIKQGDSLSAIFLYTLQTIGAYTLMSVSDLLWLEEEAWLREQVKACIREEQVDEVQYVGSDPAFFDGFLKSVKKKNGNMIVYPNHGDSIDVAAVADQVCISKLVTDHL